ncbi:hypothetical protein GCM10023189_23670 [Nibrella saemangeumensis]|uniref:Urease accessory protein UreH-like transmembrane domain-containing protein n=1 Tax=Nibrella saemangeumensis TaxID=1084526 RepID=A0ABP8MVQ1_9BACT
MESLLIGSLVISVIHAALPNHWLPVVLIGRSENWSLRDTLSVSAISGLFHTFSTVLLGVLIGAVGLELSERMEHQTRWLSSGLLIGMGIIYLARPALHTHKEVSTAGTGRSKRAIIVTLAMAMLFSPCLEIEAFFFTAGTYGWLSIVTLAVFYTVFTVGGMVLLTALSFRGLAHLHGHWLEHHEKRLTGGMLIGLGIVNLFVSI